MIKRTIIKLSGEAIAGGKGQGFCDETINGLIAQVKKVLDLGIEVGLIVGGGNYWRGRSSTDMDRVRSDQIGMLATVMNAIYLSESLRNLGIPSEVMTPMPFANMTRVYDKHSALKLMSKGVVTFHAAGLCHPYFSTDSVTALRAAELEVDRVLFTKNGVGGVYDKAPGEGVDAKMYKSLTYATAIEKRLQFVDAAALNILVEAKIPSFVFGLDEPDGISRACAKSIEFGTMLNTTIEEEFYVSSN